MFLDSDFQGFLYECFSFVNIFLIYSFWLFSLPTIDDIVITKNYYRHEIILCAQCAHRQYIYLQYASYYMYTLNESRVCSCYVMHSTTRIIVAIIIDNIIVEGSDDSDNVCPWLLNGPYSLVLSRVYSVCVGVTIWYYSIYYNYIVLYVYLLSRPSRAILL